MKARRGGPAGQEITHLAIASAFVLVIAAGAAWARPLSGEEKAALAATVESFEAAMREGNYARVVQTKPPKLIDALARHIEATPYQIGALMIKTMQQMKVESFGIDLGTADHKDLASGTPYVLIPTEEIVAFKGRRFRARSHTLAFLDEGKWFLLSEEEARQMHRLKVDPEFTSVEFPRSSTEMLNP